MTKITTLEDGKRYATIGDSLIPLPLPDQTIMKPELVDFMLDDMGFSSPEVREAVMQYCLGLIDIGSIECADVRLGAVTYAEGYEACLKKHS